MIETLSKLSVFDFKGVKISNESILRYYFYEIVTSVFDCVL
jgi:hypothetical protein